MLSGGGGRVVLDGEEAGEESGVGDISTQSFASTAPPALPTPTPTMAPEQGNRSLPPGRTKLD